mgnify:CR=1 FL=1
MSNKKAAYRKSDMLPSPIIYGNGTYDYLSCKRHHQLFATNAFILLQRKTYNSIYARKIVFI